MAIFHMSAKAVSRSGGRSATGSAAYRAGEKIKDKRTGEIHDFTRKGGVEDTVIVLPTGSDWTPSREELWNAAELSEKRKDACVAREFEVALPAELSAALQPVVDRALEGETDQGQLLGSQRAWMQAGSALGYGVQVEDDAVLAPGEARSS